MQLTAILFSSLFLAGAVAALPGNAAALSLEEARHLLARSGFTGKPAEIDALAKLTRSQAVAQIFIAPALEPSQNHRPGAPIGYRRT